MTSESAELALRPPRWTCPARTSAAGHVRETSASWSARAQSRGPRLLGWFDSAHLNGSGSPRSGLRRAHALGEQRLDLGGREARLAQHREVCSPWRGGKGTSSLGAPPDRRRAAGGCGGRPARRCASSSDATHGSSHGLRHRVDRRAHQPGGAQVGEVRRRWCASSCSSPMRACSSLAVRPCGPGSSRSAGSRQRARTRGSPQAAPTAGPSRWPGRRSRPTSGRRSRGRSGGAPSPSASAPPGRAPASSIGTTVSSHDAAARAIETSMRLPRPVVARSTSAASTWVNSSSPAFRSMSGRPHSIGGPSAGPVRSMKPSIACSAGS